MSTRIVYLGGQLFKLYYQQSQGGRIWSMRPVQRRLMSTRHHAGSNVIMGLKIPSLALKNPSRGVFIKLKNFAKPLYITSTSETDYIASSSILARYSNSASKILKADVAIICKDFVMWEIFQVRLDGKISFLWCLMVH